MGDYDTVAKCLFVTVCVGALYYVVLRRAKKTREAFSFGGGKSKGKDKDDDSDSSNQYDSLAKKINSVSKDLRKMLDIDKNKSGIKAALEAGQNEIDNIILYQVIGSCAAMAKESVNDIGTSSTDDLGKSIDDTERLEKLRGQIADALKTLGGGLGGGGGASSLF
tara:strand:- start:3 stop:497 length:495 start_codon:yes stop_codon:yes gene_type:complete